MELPELDNKHLATVVIGAVAVAALFSLGIEAKEIAIAAVAAIGGAMAAK